MLKVYDTDSVVTQSCLTLCDPMDWPTGLLLSTELSRPEHQSRLPSLPPGDLANLGMEPGSPALQMNSLQSESPGKPPKGTWGQCWNVNGGQSKFHCSTDFMTRVSHFLFFMIQFTKLALLDYILSLTFSDLLPIDFMFPRNIRHSKKIMP